MDLPPEEIIRAVTQRYARLIAELGGEIGERPLVLPDGTFFPDTFTGDEKSAATLVSRMQEHAGMDDIPIQTRVVSADGPSGPSKSSCSSGACAAPAASSEDVPRLQEEGEGWVLQIPAAELAHPVVLTTNVARALGTVFMLETAEDDDLVRDLAVEGELAAVALGFGVLLLAGSYMYSKSCGGPSVAKVTKLSTPELALSFALFARSGGHGLRRAVKELEATQTDLVQEFDELLKSNPTIIERLKKNPARLAGGDFELTDAKPWLLRLFGGKRKAKPAGTSVEAVLADPSADLDEIEAMVASMPVQKRDAERKADPHDDEIKSLVDEALSDLR